MTTIMYGIPNCDTIKKAQKWLNENNIEFSFHDYRKDGLDANLVQSLLTISNWEVMLNKRSTSYRALTEEQKTSLTADTIIPLFVEFPTLIKRPFVVYQGKAIVGFNIKNYQSFFTA